MMFVAGVLFLEFVTHMGFGEIWGFGELLGMFGGFGGARQFLLWEKSPRGLRLNKSPEHGLNLSGS